jgi:hypothetical protein
MWACVVHENKKMSRCDRREYESRQDNSQSQKDADEDWMKSRDDDVQNSECDAMVVQFTIEDCWS